MTRWLMVLRFIASFLPKKEIYAEDSKLYLERFLVFGWTEGSSWRGPSLYLHRFHLPDQDVALHNHPWRRAYALILAGGYDESRSVKVTRDLTWMFDSIEVDKRQMPGSQVAFTELENFTERTLRSGRFNAIGPNDYHRITALHGETWTLFFVWPKSRSWGFWIPGRGHVEWRQRLTERGIQL